ncbi:MAG TPA: 50S ribosomal protein L18 [Parcubacteria group bacterium]|nr:50S ribosomal protein L18 [Parcubacteria group bacterium]
MNTQKSQKRIRNHKKIRTQVAGTSERPRLAIFKSNTAIYAQVINDDAGVTLASAKGTDAKKVGAEVAKAAQGKKIESVVFDRGGYIYTGKVKDLADSAREAGLKF